MTSDKYPNIELHGNKTRIKENSTSNTFPAIPLTYIKLSPIPAISNNSDIVNEAFKIAIKINITAVIAQKVFIFFLTMNIKIGAMTTKD